MKKLFLITCLFLSANYCFGQMTLDHTFAASASIVLFSSNGEKIATNDTVSLYLYNMDYTLWKTITPPGIPGYKVSAFSVISDNLFNSDGLVEAIVSYIPNEGNYSIHPYYRSSLINETGAVLFSLDSCYGGFPFYDQDNSTYKLFVYNYLTAPVGYRVYSVSGTLPCGQCSELGTQRLASSNNNITVSDPMPNPSAGVVRINYTIPPGNLNGTITFISSAGQTVKQMPVNVQSDFIDINNSILPAGVYRYNIVSGGLTSETRAMVIK